MSLPTPNTTQPISMPIACPSLMKGPWYPNSFTVGVRISPVTIYDGSELFEFVFAHGSIDPPAIGYPFMCAMSEAVNEEDMIKH